MAASTTLNASAMRASCTSPIRMRSFCPAIFVSRASISALARWLDSRRIWSATPFSTGSASKPESADAYAFTSLDFEKSAGPFRQARRLCPSENPDRSFAQRRRTRSALCCSMAATPGKARGWPTRSRGADMVEAANLLGVEAMTGHWEFTYGEDALRSNLERFKGEFLAQNVFLTEEAAFNGAKAFDPASGRVFKPAIDQGSRRLSCRGDRSGVSLRSDRASKAFHAGLDLRHSRTGIANADRQSARYREGRRGAAAVA